MTWNMEHPSQIFLGWDLCHRSYSNIILPCYRTFKDCQARSDFRFLESGVLWRACDCLKQWHVIAVNMASVADTALIRHSLPISVPLVSYHMPRIVVAGFLCLLSRGPPTPRTISIPFHWHVLMWTSHKQTINSSLPSSIPYWSLWSVCQKGINTLLI